MIKKDNLVNQPAVSIEYKIINLPEKINYDPKFLAGLKDEITLAGQGREVMLKEADPLPYLMIALASLWRIAPEIVLKEQDKKYFLLENQPKPVIRGEEIDRSLLSNRLKIETDKKHQQKQKISLEEITERLKGKSRKEKARNLIKILSEKIGSADNTYLIGSGPTWVFLFSQKIIRKLTAHIYWKKSTSSKSIKIY